MRPSTFAVRFDAACAARWPTNEAVAAAIRADLAHVGLDRTNRVQVSRWRHGRTVPSLAVQHALAGWLATAPG